MKNQIKEPDDLLDEKGMLKQAGWSIDLLLKYKRSAIQASNSK